MGKGKWIIVLVVFAGGFYCNSTEAVKEITSATWIKLSVDEMTAIESELGSLMGVEKTVRSAIGCASLCLGHVCGVFCFNKVTSACYINTGVNMIPSMNLSEDFRCFFLRGQCAYYEGYTSFMQGVYCLKLYTSPAKYSDARDTCARDGGHLFKVGSVKDKLVFNDSKITDHLPGSLFIWVGAVRDPNNTNVFVWSDGTPVSSDPNLWRDGEPDNFNGIQDCVSVQGSSGRSLGLHDSRCQTLQVFLCQIDLPTVQ